MSFSIAIDGPAGAGKSTIAKRVAKERGCIYVDTGAMYRAMALFFLREGVSKDDEATISSKVDSIDVKLEYVDGAQKIILNGEDVSGLIRTEDVGNMASAVSVYGPVRAKLVALQQQLAATTSVVMDGRDIGTVVLPNANLKVYLTASVETRAKRRFLELEAKGIHEDIEVIKADIADRDHRDMTRTISPLKQAEDAILIDSSDMNIDEVTDAILSLAKERE